MLSTDIIHSNLTYPLVVVRGSPEFSKNMSILFGLLKGSQSVLFKITTILALSFNRNSLTIDENKVNLVHKGIVFGEHVHSILVENITNITVNIGFLTATLCVTDSSNSRFPVEYCIMNLRKKDALKARRIIQGLIATKKSKVDLSQMDAELAVYELEKLGEAKGAE